MNPISVELLKAIAANSDSKLGIKSMTPPLVDCTGDSLSNSGMTSDYIGSTFLAGVDSTGNFYVAFSRKAPNKPSPPGVWGNFALAGIILKFDFDNNLVWKRVIHSEKSNSWLYLDSFTVASNGDLFLSFAGPTDSQILVKYDTDGSIIWSKKVDSNPIFAPNIFYTDATNNRVDSSGNWYLTSLYPEVPADIAVIKLTSTGAVSWQKVIDPGPIAADAWAPVLTLDNSSNAYVAFASGPSDLNPKINLIKVSSAGSVTWARQVPLVFPGGWLNYTHRPRGIKLDSDGNIYVLATTFPASITSVGYVDTMLLKFNPSGALTAAIKIPAGVAREDGCLLINNSNEIYLFLSHKNEGGFNWFAPKTNALVMKLNSSLSTIWTRRARAKFPSGTLCRINILAGGFDGSGGIPSILVAEDENDNCAPFLIRIREDGNNYATNVGNLAITYESISAGLINIFSELTTTSDAPNVSSGGYTFTSFDPVLAYSQSDNFVSYGSWLS